jgi:hypothetical protein
MRLHGDISQKAAIVIINVRVCNFISNFLKVKFVSLISLYLLSLKLTSLILVRRFKRSCL